MRRSAGGFSLIELLITLVILGILATLTAPSVRDMIFNNRITSSANDMLADVATARSEAARRSARIGICKNATGAGANTTCDHASAWSDGWIMFVDANANGWLDSGESVLRVRQSLPTGMVLTPSGVGDYVLAKPVGNVTPLGSWKLCDSRSGNYGRLVTLSATGRASVSTTNCP